MALQTTLYVKNISLISLSAPDDVQWSYLDVDGEEAINEDGTLKPNHIINLYELNGRVVIAESTELKELINDDKLVILDSSMEVKDKTNSLYSVGLSTVSETEIIAKDEIIEEEGIVWNSQNDVYEYSTEKLEGKEVLIKENNYTVDYPIKDCILVLEQGVNLTIPSINNTEVLGRNENTILNCNEISSSIVDVSELKSLSILSSNLSFDTLNFIGDDVVVKYSLIFGETVNFINQLNDPDIDGNSIHVNTINHNNTSTTSSVSTLRYQYKNTNINSRNFKSNIRWQSSSKDVQYKFGGAINIGELRLNRYSKVYTYSGSNIYIGVWSFDNGLLSTSSYTRILLNNISKTFEFQGTVGQSLGNISYSKYGFECLENNFTTKN